MPGSPPLPLAPPLALFPHFPSLAWSSAPCTEPEVGGDLCSWVVGSLGDSCRNESVGLWRGDGSDDSLTPGRTKEEEKRETVLVSFKKSLCGDGGEGGGRRRGVLPGAPTPLGRLPQELTVNTPFLWELKARLRRALGQLNQDLVTFQAKWVPRSPPSTRQASLGLEGPDHHGFPLLASFLSEAHHQLPSFGSPCPFPHNLTIVASTVDLLLPRLAATRS